MHDICRFISQENAELILKRRYTITLQQGFTWVVRESLQLRCSTLININKKLQTWGAVWGYINGDHWSMPASLTRLGNNTISDSAWVGRSEFWQKTWSVSSPPASSFTNKVGSEVFEVSFWPWSVPTVLNARVTKLHQTDNTNEGVWRMSQ